jgi:hypothetical protein
MNIYIVGGIAAYACLVMLALAFNHGAHRRPSSREERRIDQLEEV